MSSEPHDSTPLVDELADSNMELDPFARTVLKNDEARAFWTSYFPSRRDVSGEEFKVAMKDFIEERHHCPTLKPCEAQRIMLAINYASFDGEEIVKAKAKVSVRQVNRMFDDLPNQFYKSPVIDAIKILENRRDFSITQMNNLVAEKTKVENNDTNADAWNNLGVAMVYLKMYQPQVIIVCGDELLVTQVMMRTLELAPNSGKAWNTLGIGMLDDEKVTVGGQVYTKQQCYLKSLSILPHYSFAWNWLGMTIPVGETVSVNGGEYTSRHCYCRAIVDHGSDYAYAWYNLFIGMEPGDAFDFPDGRKVTYGEALNKNVAFYPSDPIVQARASQFKQ